jgi:lipopolysaccharide/colanic/teichoic acid biosynthesis glycosyltransferase
MNTLAVRTIGKSVEQEPTYFVTPWCLSLGKRLFDLVVATLLLAGVSPLMILVAIIIKLTSPGPVLFKQQRLGQNGEPFVLLKFRSMVNGSHKAGPGLTQKGDPRVSPCGRFLRKWKLDELPQLLNVVRGDMSMVGPRPDLAEHFAELPPKERTVLRLRPGVTGMASLKFRNEEELLAGIPVHELKRAYVTHVKPVKIALDMQYAQRATLVSDLGVLIRTATAILQ